MMKAPMTKVSSIKAYVGYLILIYVYIDLKLFKKNF